MCYIYKPTGWSVFHDFMDTKKERVIEVATTLFAELGFENTSVAKICETADVSKGLLYHHFNSKDDLLREIFNQNTAKMMEMNQHLPSTPPTRESLIEFIKLFFTQLKDDKLFFQLNLNIMFQPSTRKILSGLIKERSELLLDSVKVFFDEISPENSKAASYLFIAQLDGIAIDYLSVFDTYPLEDIREHLITMYIN